MMIRFEVRTMSANIPYHTYQRGHIPPVHVEKESVQVLPDGDLFICSDES